MKVCPNCGACEDTDSMFCLKCGVTFPLPESQHAPEFTDAFPENDGRTQSGAYAQNTYAPASGFSPAPAENFPGEYGKAHTGNCYGNNVNQVGANGAQYAASQVNPHPADTNSIGFFFLGFFFPLVGLILFFVWRKERPGDAKKSLIGALVPAVLAFLISVGIVLAVLLGGAAFLDLFREGGLGDILGEILFEIENLF